MLFSIMPDLFEIQLMISFTREYAFKAKLYHSIFSEPKKTRFWFSRLRQRRNRSHLDKPESLGKQSVHRFCIFVKARSKTHRVDK